MVGRVLSGKGITAYGDGHDRLIGGEEVLAHRSRHRSPGPLRVLRSPRTPAGPGGGPIIP